MDKYEQIAVVGEGSYGIVLKCRHKETDQLVAIKKFLETEEDATIRKMALREIRMLKRLKHENLVTMIEVFRYRKRFYLVFEYLEGTILDELEKHSGGLGEEACRERIYQITRAVNYCHSNQIIHRDVKPENVLVSSLGVVKLCDFGFARLVTLAGEQCTDYVATRWYRAPELLVGETNYGGGVDVWAIGCLFAEIMTGDPIFPGESDIDQLYLIVQMLGNPCEKHQQLMSKRSMLRGMIKIEPRISSTLEEQFSNWSMYALDFLISCLKMDPSERATTEELLKSAYFTHDRFQQRFLPVLREKVNLEFNSNPLLRKHKTEILMSTDKKDDVKMKKLQTEIKWKFNLSEGSVKRKYSSEPINETSEKNLITLSKTSQRLSVVSNQKTNSSSIKQTSVPNLKSGKTSTSTLTDFLARSTNKLESPQQSPLKTLSINNLEFNNKDYLKKSPHLNQESSHYQQQLKSNQVPSLGKNFMKKFERNVIIDNMLDSGIWLGNFTATLQPQKKKEQQRPKPDVFTLPNLPGIVQNTSPSNRASNSIQNFNKKKTLAQVDLTNTVSPDYRYRKAKRKLKILDLALPREEKGWQI